MTIYTRTGDKGESTTLTGERLAKTDAVFECGGTIDELSALAGVVRAGLDADRASKVMARFILRIQEDLVLLGAYVSSGDETHLESLALDPAVLETVIDEITAKRKIEGFVIPGHSTLEAHCHQTRAVCRRAERRLLGLAGTRPSSAAARYLNRLSDFFFALALWAREPLDLQFPETGDP